LPRSSHPQLLYDVDNIVLGGRFYHSFIDKSLNFVTGKYEQGFRERMLTQIMQSTNKWNKEYSYEDFKKEKS